jgi:23S rRNA (adenine-N6)-dimethyltransferase
VAAPTRRWGWHRLDPRWATRLVADTGLTPGALVLDLGAGDGALTAPLVAAGARVLAVEVHAGRAGALRERFAGCDAVTVVEADLADLRLPHRPFHVVANPPFGLTATVVRTLLAPGSRLVSAHLVLERTAVRRWSGPDAPGARRWGRRFAVSAGPAVPRSAFHPRPAVDTGVLVIRRR